jgi:hypothetical protein
VTINSEIRNDTEVIRTARNNTNSGEARNNIDNDIDTDNDGDSRKSSPSLSSFSTISPFSLSLSSLALVLGLVLDLDLVLIFANGSRNRIHPLFPRFPNPFPSLALRISSSTCHNASSRTSSTSSIFDFRCAAKSESEANDA